MCEKGIGISPPDRCITPNLFCNCTPLMCDCKPCAKFLYALTHWKCYVQIIFICSHHVMHSCLWIQTLNLSVQIFLHINLFNLFTQSHI